MEKRKAVSLCRLSLWLGQEWLEELRQSPTWKRNAQHPVQMTKMVFTAQPYVNFSSTNEQIAVFTLLQENEARDKFPSVSPCGHRFT